MNEKLFRVRFEQEDGRGEIVNGKGVELTAREVVDLLNEQQSTINELKAKLKEKEEDERLYANEILELRETNKEHIKFKSLGGNY